MIGVDRVRKALVPRRERPGHDARDVARYIVWRTLENDDPKSGLALINLLYFCHVWMLAMHGRPLCRQPFRVTGWGPRIDGVFGSAIDTKHFDRPVMKLPEGQRPPGEMLDETERKQIDRVIDTWGQEGGWQLHSAATAPDAPWDQTRMAKGGGVVIPNKRIREHYRRFVRKAS